MIAIDVVRVAVVSVLALAVGTGWAGIPLLFGALFVASTRRGGLPLGEPGAGAGRGAAAVSG